MKTHFEIATEIETAQAHCASIESTVDVVLGVLDGATERMIPHERSALDVLYSTRFYIEKINAILNDASQQLYAESKAEATANA